MLPTSIRTFRPYLLVLMGCLLSQACRNPLIDPSWPARSKPSDSEVSLVSTFFSSLNANDPSGVGSVTTNDTVYFTWIPPNDPKLVYPHPYQFTKTPITIVLPNLYPINNRLYKIYRLQKQDNGVFVTMDLGVLNHPNQPPSNVFPAYFFVISDGKIIEIRPIPVLIDGV